MPLHHFALASAQSKIRKFFQDASARSDSADGNDADTEGDCGEFGCVREGTLLTGLLLAAIATFSPSATVLSYHSANFERCLMLLSENTGQEPSGRWGRIRS